MQCKKLSQRYSAELKFKIEINSFVAMQSVSKIMKGPEAKD